MIPIAAVAVSPSSRMPERSMDVRGQITAILAVLALVFSIIQGPVVGWSSPQTLVGFALAAIFIAAFVVFERRTTAPLVRMDLFHSPGFVVAAFAAMAILFAIVGIAFVLSLFLARVQHLSVLEIAARLGFLYLFAAVAGPVAGYLQRRMGSRVPLVGGLVIAAVGVAALSTVGDGASLWDIGWTMSLTGAGVGAVLSTVSAVAIHAAPSHLAGMAGATNTLFRQIGAALGPAIVGTIIATRLGRGAGMHAALQTSTLVIAATLAGAALLSAAVLFAPRRGPRAGSLDGSPSP
jgi:hypothetical protein